MKILGYSVLAIGAAIGLALLSPTVRDSAGKLVSGLRPQPAD
ncbi:MAG: hypothetical protein JWO84_377 [Parcubacteria group bacterium]|nr:hypothetical protein [Parcubacteria group bacterium]